jgi:hypothetical protein
MGLQRTVRNAASLCFFLAAEHAIGHGARPLNQAPAGVAIEPVVKAAPAGVTIEPVVKGLFAKAIFTNATDRELAITFDNKRFRLSPGKIKSVPSPPKGMVDLRIAENPGNGLPMRERVQGKFAPRNPKVFVPFPWAGPNNP